MAEYRLRPATPADFELAREAKLEGLRPYVEALWGWDAEDQARRFRDSFVPARVQIVECGERAVGWLEVEDEGDTLWLVGIYLLAAERGQGVGGAVVRDVIERGARAGKAVRLQVLRPNPARELYARLGFRVTEESETHIQMRRDGERAGLHASSDPPSSY